MTKAAASSLAPILRSDTQGRLLARVLLDPAAEHTLSELVRWAGSSMPTVLREVERAEQAGIVVTRKLGPARLVRADPDHPLHDVVRRLVLATYGPPAVVARELGEVDGALAVVLFGTWAARFRGVPGRAPNDVDVLVVGSPRGDDVDAAADRAERAIGLPVQATVRSREEWAAATEPFVREVKRRPLVLVAVDDGDAALAEELRALDRGADRL